MDGWAEKELKPANILAFGWLNFIIIIIIVTLSQVKLWSNEKSEIARKRK